MMDDHDLSTQVALSRDQISTHSRDQSGDSDGGGFDYETKLWGGHRVELSPTYLGALRLRYCLEDLSDVSGMVLEIGCGAGGMAKAIKDYRPDLEVYGCDISQLAIQAAQRNPGGVTFKVGDAYVLPFGDRSFTAVVAFDLLEHLAEPSRVIAEAWRVLEPGGQCHFFVPCEGSTITLHGLLSFLGWRAKEKYGGHIQRFRLCDLRDLFKISDFEIINYRWSGHLINQVVDVTYFSGLSLLGKNVPMSVEGYLETTPRGLFPVSVGMLKNAIAIASYYESRLFVRIPGSGVHLLCTKRQVN
jgi:SAM-dependent methyltransferase